MSIVAMVNLKCNEGLSAWPAFAADPARFGALFGRVIELPAQRAAQGETKAWLTLVHPL